MDPEIVITESELIEAIINASAEAEQNRGRTAQEIASSLGWGIDRVRKVLRLLHAEGRIKVRACYVPDITGRPNQRPCYELADDKE